MGQVLTFIIAVIILIYAGSVIKKNFDRVKKGQCPGGCGSCSQDCSFRADEEEKEGKHDEKV